MKIKSCKELFPKQWAILPPCQGILLLGVLNLELAKVWLGSARDEAGRSREIDHIFILFYFNLLVCFSSNLA